MKILSYTFWAVLLVGAVVLYSHWYTGYSKSVEAWGPIVQSCSEHGGFMNASGTCDYNQ